LFSGKMYSVFKKRNDDPEGWVHEKGLCGILNSDQHKSHNCILFMKLMKLDSICEWSGEIDPTVFTNISLDKICVLLISFFCNFIITCKVLG